MGPGVPSPLQPPTNFPVTPLLKARAGLSCAASHNCIPSLVQHVVSGSFFLSRYGQSSLSPLQRTHLSTAHSSDTKPSTISTGQLHPLLSFHPRPIKLVVYQRSYSVKQMGSLILRLASHLDAFSGYPFRRSLLGYATGVTTDTRALRPPRSSRTRGSSSQTPDAHSG